MIYSLKRDSFFPFFFVFFFIFFNNKTVITSYNCLFYVLLLVSRVLWRLYNYSVPKISFCLKLKGSFKYSNNTLQTRLLRDLLNREVYHRQTVQFSNISLLSTYNPFGNSSTFFSLHQNWQKRAERRVLVFGYANKYTSLGHRVFDSIDFLFLINISILK